MRSEHEVRASEVIDIDYSECPDDGPTLIEAEPQADEPRFLSNQELSVRYLVRFPKATESDLCALEALLEMVGERAEECVRFGVHEEPTCPGIDKCLLAAAATKGGG